MGHPRRELGDGMETQHAPRFLAFITYAPADHLDVAWLKDAIESASRALSIPEVMGLEEHDDLIALDADDEVAFDALGRSVFLVVLWSSRASSSTRIGERIQRFVARPTQTRAHEYLIPIIVPADASAADSSLPPFPIAQDKLPNLSAHWLPRLTRRPDDGTWSAWARVTDQTVALMARILMSATRPPSAHDERRIVHAVRNRAPKEALELARSVVADLDGHQSNLEAAHRRLDETSNAFVDECLDKTKTALGRRRFDPDAVQSEVARASDAYHDALESIVEETALRLFETERRAESVRLHPGLGAESIVPRLDPILAELYDRIAPDPPLSDQLREILGEAMAPEPGSQTRVGATVGLLLGPLGALVGGAMGTAVGAVRGHRKKKARLTNAVRETVYEIVERARPSVESALRSVADEQAALRRKWKAQAELLDSIDLAAEQNASFDTVECSVHAPTSARRGRSFMVMVFVESCDSSNPVEAQVSEEQTDLRRTLALRVAQQERLSIHLSFPDGVVAHAVQVLTWQGRTEDVGFTVTIPEDCHWGALVGTVRLSAGGVPVGQISFRVNVVDDGVDAEPMAARLSGETARHFEYAFISYSYIDHGEAEEWARYFRKNRLPFFADRLSPRAADDWRDGALDAIDHCDVFFLCWSKSAAESEWVSTEWRRALERRQRAGDRLPAIVAVYVDGAPSAPRPEELSAIPFHSADLLGR